MFRKLRNRLIIINLSITTIVILVAFTAIYLFATGSANRRPPVVEEQSETFTDDFENVINVTVRREKQAAANDLLVMLIVSGVAIEVAVAMVSFFLAEEAIKPVREAYESQKLFIANASHEIKTPLAAISANLEAADIHGNKWIDNVEKETNKLSRLNNELLTLARTDLTQKSVFDDVNLKKYAEELIASFEPRLESVNFEKNITAHGKVRMVAADFGQILGVLMDNAIKYCDKKIQLTLTNHELTVANDGVVIPEKETEHIFERFYQVDKSAEGVGLGLSIAKSVAERNGWNLIAEPNKKMTKFVLKF